MKKMEVQDQSWFAYVHANYKGLKVGYDPVLINAAQAAQKTAFFKSNFISFIPIEQNLVDAIWEHKPAMPDNEVI